ncbi:unnamed protein product [Chrysoparadoxa australica]
MMGCSDQELTMLEPGVGLKGQAEWTLLLEDAPSISGSPGPAKKSSPAVSPAELSPRQVRAGMRLPHEGPANSPGFATKSLPVGTTAAALGHLSLDRHAHHASRSQSPRHQLPNPKSPPLVTTPRGEETPTQSL